jgi:ATP-dependent DNA helicase RecG
MREAMAEAGLPPPHFSGEERFFTAVFYRPTKIDPITSEDENGIVNNVNDIVNTVDGIVNGQGGIANEQCGIVNEYYDIENEQDGIVNDVDSIVKEQDGIVNEYYDIVNDYPDGIVNNVNGIVNEQNIASKNANGIVNNTENDKETLDETKDFIFELISKKEGMSAPDIAKLIGKSWRTTMRYLNKLKGEHRIEFRGAPKTGGYYVKLQQELW